MHQIQTDLFPRQIIYSITTSRYTLNSQYSRTPRPYVTLHDSSDSDDSITPAQHNEKKTSQEMNSICHFMQPTPLNAKHHKRTSSNPAKVLLQCILFLITHGFLFTSQFIKCKPNADMYPPPPQHSQGTNIRSLYGLSHTDQLDPTWTRKSLTSTRMQTSASMSATQPQITH